MRSQHARRFWQGLAVGGVVVVMALPATAALGQTAVHHDPAHDVIKFFPDGSTQAAPGNKTADIVHVRFAHTSRRVTTTTRVRDYGGRWIYAGVIKTAASIRKYLVFGRGHRARHRFALLRGIEDPRLVPCDGLSTKVRPAKNTIRVSIPATCLRGPRWVRMGLAYSVETHDGTGSFLSDDSLRQGIRKDTLSSLPLTARLH